MAITANSVSRRSNASGFMVLAVIVAIASLATLAGVETGWIDLMPETKSLLLVGTVLFASAVLSSIVGFAFSAIAGAMIFHLVPNGVEAVQMMMLASVGIQGYTVALLYRSIPWRRCLPFVAGGICTLPFGVMVLLALPPKLYLFVIGTALVVYGAYMQFARLPPRASGEHRLADFAVGAAGGLTGPLAGFPGACLVIWCGARGWDKLGQRVIYQPYILIMQVIALALLCAQRPQSIHPGFAGCVLPGIAGAVIGLRFFKTLSDAGFKRLVNVALIVSGMALLVK